MVRPALITRSALAAALGLAALLVPAAARGQEEPGRRRGGLGGGVKGGVNASRWIGADGAMMHLGFGLGGFAVVPVAGRLSVQPEFLMHEKGSDFESTQGEDADEGLLYIEAPVLVRYELPLAGPVIGYGAAGPGLAWVIDSKRTKTGQLNKLDITFSTALGARFETGSRHRVDVELRLNAGFLDPLDREMNDETVRNLVGGLFAGVTL